MVQQTIPTSLNAAHASDARLTRAAVNMSILSTNFARRSDKLDSILEVCALEAAAPSITMTAPNLCSTSIVDDQCETSDVQAAITDADHFRMPACLHPCRQVINNDGSVTKGNGDTAASEPGGLCAGDGHP